MHVVKLTIEEEKDLFNPFDADDDVLSEDVKAYMLDRLQKKELGDDVEIRIVSNSPVGKARVEKAFHMWIDEELGSIKSEYRKNTLQQLWMFGVGVVFIALSLALESKVGVVWFTVLSTIGAFSMWEAASIWIVQNPKLRLRKRLLLKLQKNTAIEVERTDEVSEAD